MRRKLIDADFQQMPSNAIVELAPPDADGLRYIRVKVDIDLADPPELADLETAGVLSFKRITKQLWEDSTFTWDQCKAGVIERPGGVGKVPRLLCQRSGGLRGVVGKTSRQRQGRFAPAGARWRNSFRHVEE